MMCIGSKEFFFIKKLGIFSTTMPAAEQKKRQLFRVNYLHCTCCCSLWLWLLSFSKKFSKFPNEAVHKCSLSDDTHYDVHENCLIFKTPRTPCPSTSKILHPLVQFQTNHPSPNDNQSIKRKHNPKISIICY